jgi:hypothetical protein
VPGGAAPKTMLVHRFMGAVHMEWKGGSKATLPPLCIAIKKIARPDSFLFNYFHLLKTRAGFQNFGKKKIHLGFKVPVLDILYQLVSKLVFTYRLL